MVCIVHLTPVLTVPASPHVLSQMEQHLILMVLIANVVQLVAPIQLVFFASLKEMRAIQMHFLVHPNRWLFVLSVMIL